MTWHPSTVIQSAGLTLSLLGWVSSCVATYVPLWKTLSLDLNKLQTWNMGLWQVCVAQEGNIMECKNHNSFLALPLDIKVSRVIMVASNVLGCLAITLSTSGSNCTKTRDRQPGLTKRRVVGGGIASCLSGMMTLAPISWIAYNVVQEFWDETVPDVVPRWEFGDALFLGWFAGFSLTLGSFLLIYSACFLVPEQPPRQSAVHQLEMQKPTMLPNGDQNSSPKHKCLVI